MSLSNPQHESFRQTCFRCLRFGIWPTSLLLGLCALTFLLSHIAPGDTARIILGPAAREDAVAALRGEMGLDKPVVVQFLTFLRETVTGHWGTSWITRQPVLLEIGDHLRPTLFLGFFASVYSITAALLLNALAFAFPRFGKPMIPLLRLGISLPSFVVAVAAALAMSSLQMWTTRFSESNGDSLWVYAVPAIAVALYPACVMATLLRDRFSDILASPFFRAARASGYSRSALFERVLFRNAWPTLLAAWVNQISLLVYSTIIIEYVFSFRGLGTLLISSIQGKDLPVLSGIILLNGLFFLVVQTLSGRSSGRREKANFSRLPRPEEVQVT